MSEELENTEAPEIEEAPEPVVVPDEPKIMCYVSKKMVPKSQTVEIEYSAGKKVWVLGKYVKYDTSAEA